jgi:hypothetical protein
MSALSRFVLRPLAFPSHRFAAVVCLATGRVVAVQRSSDASPLPLDIAASGDRCGPSPDRDTASPKRHINKRLCRSVSAGGNARRVASVERFRTLSLVS